MKKLTPANMKRDGKTMTAGIAAHSLIAAAKALQTKYPDHLFLDQGEYQVNSDAAYP